MKRNSFLAAIVLAYIQSGLLTATDLSCYDIFWRCGSRYSELARVSRPLTKFNRKIEGEVINALWYYPAAEREELVSIISKKEKALLSQSNENAAKVINALWWYPAVERVELVKLITDRGTRLLSKDQGNVLDVINALGFVPGVERKVLIRLITARATRLVREDRDNASAVIRALWGVPADEREALVGLITARATCLVREDRDNAHLVIAALREVPADEREAFIRLITAPETRLLREDWSNVLGVIEALKLIHVSERSALVNLITARGTRLLTPNLANELDVIVALREVPATERAALVRLITNEPNRLVMDDRMNAVDVIDALRRVPAAEREAMVRLITEPATRLVWDNLWNAADVIRALSEVPAGERGDFVRLITNEPNRLAMDDRKNAVDVIDALRRVPAAGRTDRVASARAAVRALPWWREGIIMTNAQRDTFNHRVIIELMRDPAHPAVVARQEAIYDEVQAMRGAYVALTTDPRSRDVITANLPALEETDKAFDRASATLTLQLEDILSGVPRGASLGFRITQALGTLRLFQGRATITSFLIFIFGVRDYQNYAYEGLPNIRQLFVLATRLLAPVKPEDFIRSWMGENLRDQARWDAFRGAFGDRFPAIATQSNVGLALGADGVRGNGFVTFLAKALWENTQEVSPAMRRPLMKLKAAYRTHTQDRLMPLIEGLFMVMRAHNSEGHLLDPSEPNRPVCADGVYLNLLKAITQTPGIAEVVAQELAGVELEDCATEVGSSSSEVETLSNTADGGS